MIEPIIRGTVIVIIGGLWFAASTLWMAAAARASPPLILSCDSFPATASAETLQHALGSPDVGVDSVPLGDVEGEMVPATVLFPNVPTRRIEIVWKDLATRRSPRYVRLSRAPTEWKTPQGITIGTSLRELERLNRRPFRLAGFAFDGSGAVSSWDGGQLTPPPASSCELRMWLDSLVISTAGGRQWYRQVTGGRLFSSGHPAMQALNPRVSQLLLIYR